jgi:hypothetical protein
VNLEDDDDETDPDVIVQGLNLCAESGDKDNSTAK